MGERETRGREVGGASVLEALHTVYRKGLMQAGIIKIVALERTGHRDSTQAETGPADRGAERKIWGLYTRNGQVAVCRALQADAGHMWGPV